MSKYFTASAYYSVCPFVRIGSPAPSTVSGCVPTPGTKGGEGNTRMQGGGSQFGRLERKPCILSTLCLHLCCDNRSLNTYCTQCPSPLRNWDPPPSSPASCPSSPNQRGGGAQSLAAKGVGGPNSDAWRKSLVLCLLYTPVSIFQKCTEYFLLSLNLSFHSNVPRNRQINKCTYNEMCRKWCTLETAIHCTWYVQAPSSRFCLSRHSKLLVVFSEAWFGCESLSTLNFSTSVSWVEPRPSPPSVKWANWSWCTIRRSCSVHSSWKDNDHNDTQKKTQSFKYFFQLGKGRKFSVNKAGIF